MGAPVSWSHLNLITSQILFLLLCAQSFSHVWLCAIPWTVARQAPVSMGILQAWVLERIAIPSSKGSSQPRDRNCTSRVGRHILCHCTTWNHHRIGGRLECHHINLGVTQSFIQNKKLLKKQAPQMSSYSSATFNILMNTFSILKYYIFSLLSGNFIMTLNISIKYDFNG